MYCSLQSLECREHEGRKSKHYNAEGVNTNSIPVRYVQSRVELVLLYQVCQGRYEGIPDTLMSCALNTFIIYSDGAEFKQKT